MIEWFNQKVHILLSILVRDTTHDLSIDVNYARISNLDVARSMILAVNV